MRAAQFDEFGKATVLHVRDAARPFPTLGQVQVQVHASSVNQHDRFVRSGRMRIATGSKFPFGSGVDFTGVISSTLAGDSSAPAAGTRVWGTLPGFAHRFSAAAADFLVVPSGRVAPLPAELSYAQGAALVAGGTAALTAMRDIARLRPGERVLIRGGVGAVGSCAVEYAHALGAHVSTTVSDPHRDLAAELGADEVYPRDIDPTTLGPFDVVLDTVGTELRAFRRRLSPRGRMVTVAISKLPELAYLGASVVHGRQRVRTFLGAPDATLLNDLAHLAADRAMRARIDTTYELDDIVEAHEAAEAGGSRGKHVLQLVW